MAVDLRFGVILNRRSLVLYDDHVVVLEHGVTRDRVRRIAYDRIQSVLSWRGLPWGRMLFFAALFGAPGLLLLTVGATPHTVIGLTLLVCTALIEARYLTMRLTRIRITRADKHYDFKGVVSRRKVARCLQRLDEDIRQAQHHAEERALEQMGEG